jgi:hypothetical protein
MQTRRQHLLCCGAAGSGCRIHATMREHNPLLFDLLLKKSVRWQGQGLRAEVFHTRRHLEHLLVPSVAPGATGNQ